MNTQKHITPSIILTTTLGVILLGAAILLLLFSTPANNLSGETFIRVILLGATGVGIIFYAFSDAKKSIDNDLNSVSNHR